MVFVYVASVCLGPPVLPSASLGFPRLPSSCAALVCRRLGFGCGGSWVVLLCVVSSAGVLGRGLLFYGLVLFPCVGCPCLSWSVLRAWLRRALPRERAEDTRGAHSKQR